MGFFRIGGVVITIIFWSRLSWAASEDLFCPDSLGQNNTKQELVEPVDGWLAKQQFAGYSLRDGGIYEVSLDGDLVPIWGEEHAIENESALVESYLIKLEQGRTMWLVCEYYSTSVVLRKKIPLNYKECIKSMLRNDQKSPFVFENVHCK